MKQDLLHQLKPILALTSDDGCDIKAGADWLIIRGDSDAPRILRLHGEDLELFAEWLESALDQLEEDDNFYFDETLPNSLATISFESNLAGFGGTCSMVINIQQDRGDLFELHLSSSTIYALHDWFCSCGTLEGELRRDSLTETSVTTADNTVTLAVMNSSSGYHDELRLPPDEARLLQELLLAAAAGPEPQNPANTHKLELPKATLWLAWHDGYRLDYQLASGFSANSLFLSHTAMIRLALKLAECLAGLKIKGATNGTA